MVCINQSSIALKHLFYTNRQCVITYMYRLSHIALKVNLYETSVICNDHILQNVQFLLGTASSVLLDHLIQWLSQQNSSLYRVSCRTYQSWHPWDYRLLATWTSLMNGLVLRYPIRIHWIVSRSSSPSGWETLRLRSVLTLGTTSSVL